MDIRRARADDAAAVAHLLNVHIGSTTIEWTRRTRSVAEAAAWIDEHHVVLVADDDGEVVGLAGYGWFRDAVRREGYRRTVEHTIHVREDRWGAGVGRLLVEALLAEARAQGVHVVVAAIDGDNAASIAFHARLGFVEVARMPEVGALDGRWLDLVLMQRVLDDRAAPPGA